MVLPETPRYAVAGQLSKQGETWRLRQMNGRLGSTDLAGEVALDRSGPRPLLTGDLQSRALDFEDLAPLIGLTLAAAFVTKYATILFVPATLAILCIAVFLRRGFWPASLSGLLAAVLVAGPIGAFFALDSQVLLGLAGTTTERVAMVMSERWNLLFEAIRLSGIIFLLGVLGLIFTTRNRVLIGLALVGTALLVPGYHIAKTEPVRFSGQGWTRTVYFVILVSHIVLAVVQLPLIVMTIRLGLRDDRARHRRWAKVTAPMWLYVSVTGVVVYLMLYRF